MLAHVALSFGLLRAGGSHGDGGSGNSPYGDSGIYEDLSVI